MTNPMIQHRDINKIQTLIFIQQLYAYLLILRYLELLSKQTLSGNKTKLTYPDGTVVNYTYDNANRLSSIINGGGRTYSFQYDSLGRRTKLSMPNGTSARGKHRDSDHLK